MDLEEKLEKIKKECPLVPHTQAGRLFSMVRRMKAEKEMSIPVNRRSGFSISTETGKVAKDMTEQQWKKFYEDLCNELKKYFPELYYRVFTEKKLETIKPEQCHLWQKENLTSDDIDFEIVEKIIDSSHFMRYIVRCKQCGQLYWDEWYEQVNFDGGDDEIEQIYIPLERYDIGEIKIKPPLIAVLDYTPRLISDSKEKNKFKWIGK